jgi:hypothetical protein
VRVPKLTRKATVRFGGRFLSFPDYVALSWRSWQGRFWLGGLVVGVGAAALLGSEEQQLQLVIGVALLTVAADAAAGLTQDVSSERGVCLRVRARSIGVGLTFGAGAVVLVRSDVSAASEIAALAAAIAASLRSIAADDYKVSQAGFDDELDRWKAAPRDLGREYAARASRELAIKAHNGAVTAHAISGLVVIGAAVVIGRGLSPTLIVFGGMAALVLLYGLLRTAEDDFVSPPVLCYPEGHPQAGQLVPRGTQQIRPLA